MALKGLCFVSLLFFSVFYCRPSLARDLKHLDKIARFNESKFFIPRNLSTSGSPFSTSVSNRFSAGFQTYLNSGHEFHGASAKISLWLIPDVKPNSISEYAIAVGTQEETGSNVIMAGFHVYPGLYKNNDLRFFTYWSTSISGTTAGCYNTVCKGFIVADEANLHPGQAMAPPLSTYNGDDIWGILTIRKDEKTKDWLLYRMYPGKTTFLGWWPKTLFTSLAGNANVVQFGGTVSFGSSELSPPMGSGHLADEGANKAAFFKQVTLFDEYGSEHSPSPDDMGGFQDKNGCYTVSSLDEADDGRMFYYGGPGGCKIN